MKRFVIIGITALIILWAGNIIYYYRQILPEPIFIKQYSDVSYYNNTFLRFNYILNKGEDNKISTVKIPEIEKNFYISDYDYNTFSNYKVKGFSIELQKEDIERIIKSGGVIDKLQVYFTNGTVKEINIGKIKLYSLPDKLHILNNFSSGSGGRNVQFEFFKAYEDIEITGIDFSELYSLNKNYNIYINTNQDELKKYSSESPTIVNNNRSNLLNMKGTLINSVTFPLKLKKGELMNVITSFENNKESPIIDIYDIRGIIKFKRDNGDVMYEDCFISYYPEFNNKIIRLLREREASN